MAAPAKTVVIDADAHVVECAHTWDFMDPADVKYKPALVEVPGETKLQYWLISLASRGVDVQWLPWILMDNAKALYAI
jgi:hypothetical protein